MPKTPYLAREIKRNKLKCGIPHFQGGQIFFIQFEDGCCYCCVLHEIKAKRTERHSKKKTTKIEWLTKQFSQWKLNKMPHGHHFNIVWSMLDFSYFFVLVSFGIMMMLRRRKFTTTVVSQKWFQFDIDLQIGSFFLLIHSAILISCFELKPKTNNKSLERNSALRGVEPNEKHIHTFVACCIFFIIIFYAFLSSVYYTTHYTSFSLVKSLKWIIEVKRAHS